MFDVNLAGGRGYARCPFTIEGKAAGCMIAPGSTHRGRVGVALSIPPHYSISGGMACDFAFCLALEGKPRDLLLYPSLAAYRVRGRFRIGYASLAPDVVVYKVERPTVGAPPTYTCVVVGPIAKRPALLPLGTKVCRS